MNDSRLYCISIFKQIVWFFIAGLLERKKNLKKKNPTRIIEDNSLWSFISHFTQVYDIHDDGKNKTLGSYCQDGTMNIPPLRSSSSTKMRVVFQSDADTNGNGFSAEYNAGDLFIMFPAPLWLGLCWYDVTG